jgi:hypothetical protein
VRNAIPKGESRRSFWRQRSAKNLGDDIDLLDLADGASHAELVAPSLPHWSFCSARVAPGDAR